MVIFFLLIGKQARDEKRRREHPEEFEHELEQQQAQIKEILRSLDLDVEKEGVEESRVVPTPPPAPEPDYPSADDNMLYIEEKRLLSYDRINVPGSPFNKKKSRVFIDVHAKKSAERASVHDDAYEQLKQQQSRLLKALGDVDSLKHAVILKEVLGPPKALQYKDERY